MKSLLVPLKFLFIIGIPLLVNGQQKIYEQITNAQRNGAKFETQQLFSIADDDKENSLEKNDFKDLKGVHLLKYEANLDRLQATHLSFQIPLDGTIKTIDLMEVSDKFYSYEVVTSRGERYEPDRSASRHFRGVIRGEEKNSLVAISFFKDDIKGVISSSAGNFNIGKLKGRELFITYNDKHLSKANAYECGIIDANFKAYDPDILNGTVAIPDVYGPNCVKLYFETEFDMFQNLGSVPNVENYVTALYNQVAILYANEGVETSISEINVWTTTDPYTSGSTAGLLSQFQSNTSAINGDLGQLLTFRNIGGGRAAGFSGLCNADVDESLSVSGNLSTTIVNVPTYSWEVMVVTHELGHLFGLRHTHACVWNGNNTAIDGCAGFTEGGCSVPPSPPASAGGTIMSYCHADPVGINFLNGFGPQPGNVLRSNVANAACLTDCNDCVASGANFDLYMKDQPADTGVEPNPNSVTWTSQDIWIRKDLDGGTTHENAEYKTLTPNGVYVRVRNLGSQTSDCAVLKVYWTKASAGLIWPTNFINYYQNVGSNSVLHGDIIGIANIPAIAPGGSTIIELPWYPPNPNDYTFDNHHFCLAARIVSPDDPMANEVVGRIEPNAQNNNNVIQKNISVHDLVSNDLPISLFFRGVSKTSKFVNILFSDKGFKGDKIDIPFFERGGTVEVTIEEKYFELLLEYGSLEGEGIKILDKNKILIYSNRARFNKVPLPYQETIGMSFKFNLEKIEPEEQVIFDIVQQDAEKQRIDGGERFYLTASKKGKTYTGKVPKLSVIPNPNNGVFDLQLAGVQQATFYIYNADGTEVERGSIEEGTTKIYLPPFLLKGIYFVKVVSGETTLNQKIVIGN